MVVTEEQAPSEKRSRARLAAVFELLGMGDDGTWSIRQLTGGWSRETHLISHDPGVQDSLVVRVEPAASLLETKVEVEHRIYLALQDTQVAVPRVLGFEPSGENPFDGPYFVMNLVDGIAPNVWDREDRATLEQDWATGGAIAASLAETLAHIHRVSTTTVDFLGTPRTLSDTARRWEAIYWEQAMVRDPVVEEAFAWVYERATVPTQSVLVHGDFRIGNTLVHERRIAAVIDWELVHLGDPHHDLAWMSLEYLSGRFTKPASSLMGGVAEREWFLAHYERHAGITVDRNLLHTYTVLAAAGLSAVLCTGLNRHAAGLNRDVRMVWNRFALPVLRAELIEMMDW